MKVHPFFCQLAPAKLLRCWQQARFVHVMHNDKFNKPYIDLINKHFVGREHVFVFYGGLGEQIFPIPDYPNVIVLRNASQFRILALFFYRAKMILLHGLFIPNLVEFVARRSRSLSKAYWIIWGGDMYPDRQDVNRRLGRQRIVRRLKGLGVVAKGDDKVARELYGFSGPCHWSLYPNPLQRAFLDRAMAARPHNEKPVVQLNNSADESVLEGLELLARFAPHLQEIRVIVSYGNLVVKEAIIETGRRLYGSKFTALTDYLSPQNYARLIVNTDIGVMLQPRQQGLGNIFGFLYCGAKVYVRSDVSTWNYLSKLGFILFDTLAIGGQSFKDFSRMDSSVGGKNHTAAAPFFDDSYLAASWRKIFAS
jgi:dTDP-N-acetylfucosamine:lipid II N-acetylfucosaminyltransferase